MRKLYAALIVLAVLPASAQNIPAHQLTITAANIVNLFTGCSGTQYLGADGACHVGGSTVTLQTNGVNNSSQALLNFVNGAAFNGLTAAFSNTSGGIVTIGFSGTLGNAGLTNSSLTIGSTSVALGGTAGTITGLTLVSPALGTPASGIMTNVTGLPLTTGVTGLLPHANIAATAVTPGSYTNTNLTVAADGTITAASNGSGGSSGISGLTAGYIPLAGSATTITGNSHIDDGITATGILTATEPLTISGSTHGITIPAGTAPSGLVANVVYASDATNGYAEVNENNTGLSRVCTAANGICLTSTGFPITIGSTLIASGSTTTTIAGLTLTSPTLTTPALGTPASGVLTNTTGLPLTSGVTGTLPIGNGGTNATSAAAGTIPNATSGTASSWTATPTLGASGTLGSITMGNATSGTINIQPVTGALGTVTASLPANTGTIAELNLAQTFSGAQTFSSAAASSVAGNQFTGAPFAGTGTTSYPSMLLTSGTFPSITTWPVAGTYFGIAEPSGSTATFIDLFNNTTSEFSIGSNGNVSVNGSLTSQGTINVVSASTSTINTLGLFAGTTMEVKSTGQLGFSSTTGNTGTLDTILCRLGAAGLSGVESAATCTNTVAGATGTFAAAAFDPTSTQTTVSCSTSGNAIFSQPFQGPSDKKVLIHLSACLGTASYTYPIAFTNSPSCYASSLVACTIAGTISASAVTVTGTTSTGSLVLEDY